jgi:hypothetical protein
MDWLLSLIVGSSTPLEALKTVETLRQGILLIFCAALVGMFIAPPILEALFREGAAFGIIAIILWAALIIGSMQLSFSVLPAYKDQLTAMRPTNLTPAFEFNTSKFEEITSLDDNQAWSLSGSGHYSSFIIGVGSMSISGGTKWEYTFYKKVPDGLVLDSIPSDGVVIREDGDVDPRIEWITHHAISEKTTYQDDYTYLGGDDSASLFETIMHVPNGTIKKNMNLDARA